MAPGRKSATRRPVPRSRTPPEGNLSTPPSYFAIHMAGKIGKGSGAVSHGGSARHVCVVVGDTRVSGQGRQLASSLKPASSVQFYEQLLVIYIILFPI